MIAFTLSRTTARFFLSQLASQRQTDEKFSMIASWIWLLQPTSCEFLSSTSPAQHFLHFYIIRIISFDVNCVKCNYRVLLSTVARHYTLTYQESKFHQHLELCVSKSLRLYQHLYWDLHDYNIKAKVNPQQHSHQQQRHSQN